MAEKRLIAIADIHGCFDEMMALMKTIKPTHNDTLVFLGDFVDHGPKTKQVVEQLIKWEEKHTHWQFLYGNHEDLMLDALVYGGRIYNSYDHWYKQGGEETAKSYFPGWMSKYDMAISQPEDHIKQKHLNWLKSRPIYYEDPDFFFVHAGIPPSMSLDEFKKAIQGGEQPVIQEAIWIRDQFIDDYRDWGKRVIFGHTAGYDGDFRPTIRENKIGIDCAVSNPAGSLCAVQLLPFEEYYYENSHQT